MSRISVFARRVKDGSFSRMHDHAVKIKQESGRCVLATELDMAWCILRYGIGYLEYHVFDFAHTHGSGLRSTFMTMDHNLTLVRMMNKPEHYRFLNDKAWFNHHFQQFLGREYLDIRFAESGELEQFCRKRDTVFAKQTDQYGGIGVKKINVSEVTDYGRLLKELRSNKQWLVEEAIVQHPRMNTLCSAAVNTIRVVTLNAGGSISVGYTLLRIGSGDKPVDNISSGGMYTLIEKDGVLHYPAFCDKTGLFYDRHPVTGTAFEGFRVPFYEEAIDLCCRAAELIPEMGYIGWDVAITEKGPVLVEGNNFPGYDMPQNGRFRTDHRGLLPEFEQILGAEIPRNYKKLAKKA